MAIFVRLGEAAPEHAGNVSHLVIVARTGCNRVATALPRGAPSVVTMSTRPHHTVLAAVVAAAVGLLPACGGDDAAAPTSSGSPPTTAPPETTTPADTTPPDTTPPTTEPPATFVDASVRPTSLPGPLDPGTHQLWTIDPPVDITLGEGWSAGWELGDQTRAPNYTAAFQHPLTDGYARIALWSMTGEDIRVDGAFRDDVREFLREHPEIDELTEHDLTLDGGWTATQFEFTVDGEPSMWLPLQVLGEPFGEEGLTVGAGRPQHWTVVDTTVSIIPSVPEPHNQLLVTWEVDGIDHDDPSAVAAAGAEAAELVAPVIASITASDVPTWGTALRFDWMSGGREVAPTSVITLGLDIWRPTATPDRLVVGDGNRMYVIDPTDESVEIAPVAGPDIGNLTYGADAIWWPVFPGTNLRRLDPDDFTEIAEIEVGINPSHVSVTGGFVWTADHRGGTVSKIDPATNERVAQFVVSGPGRGGPYGPVAQGGDLWVPVPQFDQLTRIDATTGEIKANLKLPGPGSDPVIIGDRLFAYAGSNDLVHVVDTTTNELITSVQLGAYPFAIIDVDGTPWVLAEIPGTGESWLVAIDPVTLEIADHVKVPFPATGVLDAFDSIWVSDADGSLTRYPRGEFVR